MVGRESQEWKRGEELGNNYYDQEMKVAWIRGTKGICSMYFRGSTWLGMDENVRGNC